MKHSVAVYKLVIKTNIHKCMYNLDLQLLILYCKATIKCPIMRNYVNPSEQATQEIHVIFVYVF